MDEELTARQRRVFVAIVLNDVSLDTLVIGLAFPPRRDLQDATEARRKLRAVLAANGGRGDD